MIFWLSVMQRMLSYTLRSEIKSHTQLSRTNKEIVLIKCGLIFSVAYNNAV